MTHRIKLSIFKIQIALSEIDAYKKRVKELSGKSFEEIDPIQDVMEMYLGKMTPVIQLMLQSSLGLSYEKVCLFLGTYCVQKAYRLSVVDLFDDEDGRLNTLDLMPEEKYRTVWTLISSTPTW